MHAVRCLELKHLNQPEPEKAAPPKPQFDTSYVSKQEEGFEAMTSHITKHHRGLILQEFYQALGLTRASVKRKASKEKERSTKLHPLLQRFSRQ